MSKLWNDIKEEYESLENFPSDDLWNNLEAKLNFSEQPKATVDTSAKRGHWMGIAASIVLIALSILLAEYSSNTTVKHQSAENIVIKNAVLKDNNVEKISTNFQTQQKVPGSIVETQRTKVVAFTKRATKRLPDEASLQNKISEETATINSLEEQRTMPSIPSENRFDEVVAVSEVSNISKKQLHYVSAEDLLFSRELEKYHSTQQESRFTKTIPDKLAPKSLQIFGVEVLRSQD